jgi:hypothetical protein
LVQKTPFWVAVIDAEEFLVPVLRHSVPDQLPSLAFTPGLT